MTLSQNNTDAGHVVRHKLSFSHSHLTTCYMHIAHMYYNISLLT